MPNVPVYERQVREANLPAARANVDVPTEAFGGGTVTSNIETAGKHLTGDMMEIQERSYHAALASSKMNGQNAVDTAKTFGAYGGKDKDGNFQPGVLQKITQSGPNSQFVIDEYNKQYDQFVSDYTQNLQNDEAKAAFQNQAMDGKNELNKLFLIHQAAHTEKYQKDTLDRTVEGSINYGTASFNIPGSVDEEAAKIKNNVTAYGATHGVPQENIDTMVSQPVSKLYGNAVEQYFANGMDRQGKAYYEEIKDNITDADTSKRIAKMVTDQSLKGDAQRLATQLVARHSDKTAAYDSLMNGNYSDDLKQAAKGYVNEGMERKLAAPLVKKADEIQTGANIVAQTGDYSKIPPLIESQYTDPERAQLKKIADNKNGTAPIETQSEVYNKYMHMSPQQLSKISSTEAISTVRAGLNDKDFNDFSTQWKLSLDGMGGNQGALARSTDMHDSQKLVLDEIKSAKLTGFELKDNVGTVNKDKDKRQALMDISKQAQDQITMRANLTGKPVTYDEKQAIVRGIVTDKVFVDDSWFGGKGGFFGREGTEKPATLITPVDKTKGVYMKFESIPPQSMQALYDLGKQSGGIPANMPYDQAVKKYRFNFQKAAGAAATGADSSTVRSIMGGQ